MSSSMSVTRRHRRELCAVRFVLAVMGFVICTITFGACGIWFDTLSEPTYSKLFQFLYFVSTFFGQWGPNATTWLLPSEMFPTGAY